MSQGIEDQVRKMGYSPRASYRQATSANGGKGNRSGQRDHGGRLAQMGNQEDGFAPLELFDW